MIMLFKPIFQIICLPNIKPMICHTLEHIDVMHIISQGELYTPLPIVNFLSFDHTSDTFLLAGRSCTRPKYLFLFLYTAAKPASP